MALDTVHLGTRGLRVSEIALGTWRFGGSRTEQPDITEEAAHRLLDAYADAGGNFIDTADRYGGGDSERWIGNWLETRDRDEFVIASKLGRPTLDRENLSRKYIRQQVEQSLDRLGTEYLDILYAHRWDDDTPAAEVMRSFDRLVREGRVDHLGISLKQPDAWKVVRANELAEREGYEPFAVSQPPYNLVDRAVEGNYFEMCRDYGLAVVPYNPLGEGFLAGKYQRDEAPDPDTRAGREDAVVEKYFSDRNFRVLDAVEAVAEEVGATPVQVSLAWLLHHPDVTAPIVGARTVDQLEEDLGASEVSLSAAQFERLTAAYDAADE